MRKITDQGTMAEPVAIVKEKGKEPVEITAMENDSVTLFGPEGQAKMGLEEFLQITWKEQKPKREAVPVEDWVTQAPEVSVEYFQTILRANALVRLHEFCEQHFGFHDRPEAEVRPGQRRLQEARAHSSASLNTTGAEGEGRSGSRRCDQHGQL